MQSLMGRFERLILRLLLPIQVSYDVRSCNSFQILRWCHSPAGFQKTRSALHLFRSSGLVSEHLPMFSFRRRHNESLLGVGINHQDNNTDESSFLPAFIFNKRGSQVRCPQDVAQRQCMKCVVVTSMSQNSGRDMEVTHRNRTTNRGKRTNLRFKSGASAGGSAPRKERR